MSEEQAVPMKTVLFVHGLESGPKGHKPRALADAGFHVVAMQMPCGQRSVARDPVVLAGAALYLGAATVATARWGVRGLAVSLVTAAIARPVARRAITRRIFDRSVAVQLRALASYPIDVVVGSSFGGAIALELLRLGAWSGPTILLCPAHRLVAGRAGVPFEPPASLADPSRVLIVHGRRDEVVPIDHSRALAETLGVALVEVDDDHRLGATATSEGLKGWIERVTG